MGKRDSGGSGRDGKMMECDLYPPVRDWLAARGYEIHVEMFGSDIVAVKDGQLTVVELKLGFTQILADQLTDRARWADFVMAATLDVPSYRPAWLKYNGFGYLVVYGGAVLQRIKPRQQPWAFVKRRAYRLKQLDGRPPAMEHETAGLPSCNELRLQRLAR